MCGGKERTEMYNQAYLKHVGHHSFTPMMEPRPNTTDCLHHRHRDQGRTPPQLGGLENVASELDSSDRRLIEDRNYLCRLLNTMTVPNTSTLNVIPIPVKGVIWYPSCERKHSVVQNASTTSYVVYLWMFWWHLGTLNFTTPQTEWFVAAAVVGQSYVALNRRTLVIGSEQNHHYISRSGY